LNERQQHFEELIKYSQLDDHRVKHKIENLIQMWNQLKSMSKFQFYLITIKFLFLIKEHRKTHYYSIACYNNPFYSLSLSLSLSSYDNKY